jgi:hypothetical protein
MLSYMGRIADDNFDLCWDFLEMHGCCDGRGGHEYDRVKLAWVQRGRPKPIAPFIRWAANLSSHALALWAQEEGY